MTTEQILNTPIQTSRLMFNASMLFRKKLSDCTADELLQVRARALGVKLETEDEYIDRLYAERTFEHTRLITFK